MHLEQSRAHRARKPEGLRRGVFGQASRDNRLVADYSPFDRSRLPGGATGIHLTHSTWMAAAKHNVELAAELYGAALKLAGLDSGETPQ